MRWVLLLVLLSCGASPTNPAFTVVDAGVETLKGQEGDSCPTNNLARCDGTASMLICDGGRIVRVPCKGPNGCAPGGRPSCDYRANVAGDACPTRSEGLLVCREGRSGSQAIKCVSGKFIASLCASGCEPVNGAWTECK